jgi:hypothetical protein
MKCRNITVVDLDFVSYTFDSDIHSAILRLVGHCLVYLSSFPMVKAMLRNICTGTRTVPSGVLNMGPCTESGLDLPLKC